jgi:hypothetical protein
MQINIPTEQAIIQEALQVLMAHMEPLKVARFIAACKLGEGDYLKTKDQLFADETVNSLYDKIQAFETSGNEP